MLGAKKTDWGERERTAPEEQLLPATLSAKTWCLSRLSARGNLAGNFHA